MKSIIRWYLTAFLSLSVLATVSIVGSGCAAGQRTAQPHQTRAASAYIGIRWPEESASSRFLHQVADTVRIQVKSGDTIISSVEVAKPTPGASINNLPLYKLNFVVEAFVKSDPKTLTRAEKKDVQLEPGKQNAINFTLDSVIHRLVLSENGVALRSGQTKALSVTARDASDAVLALPLETSGLYAWSSTNIGVATVDFRTGLVTARSRGTAKITVVEQGGPIGGGKSASVMVYVDNNQGTFGVGSWKGTYTWRPPAGPNSPLPVSQFLLFKSDGTVEGEFLGNRHMKGHWSGGSVRGCSFSISGGAAVQGNVSSDGKTCSGTFMFSNGSTADFTTQGEAQDGGKNLIVNGSFEQNLSTGWTVSSPHYLRTIPLSDYGFTSAVAPHGSRVLTFNGAQEPAGSWLRQTVTTVPGASYKLTFAFGKWGAPGPVQRLWIQSLDTLDGNLVIDDRRFEKPIGAVTVGNPSGEGLFAYGVSMFVHPRSTSTAIAFTDAGSDTFDTDGLLDDIRLELVEALPF